jgi:hypothetical protein
VAPVSGKIDFAKEGLEKSGKAVRLIGDDGIHYWFAHMDSISVSRGQRVEAGYTLGGVGNSGNARTTGPHLHMEMKLNGQKIDPAAFLSGGNSMPGAIPLTPDGVKADSIEQKAEARMRGLFDAVSGYMAGGTRQDYREFGTTEDIELDPTETEMQPTMQPEVRSAIR